MAIAPRVRLLVAFLLAAAAAQAPLAQEPQSGALDVAPQTGFTEPRETCGTDFLYLRSLGLTTATPLADGEPLMADQSPQILTADHSGNFTVTIQMVGVYSTMQFERGISATTETWDRTNTRMVDGTLLSIFERTYADTELAEALHVYNWGFDDGGLYWGAVIVPSSDIRRHLRLRIGSTNSPTAAVSPATSPVQLADDVQWVGSVVNIKMPEFGDSRATDGEDGLDLEIIELTKKFYEYFPDAYDSIAFIPQSQGFASYGAVHLNVKNDVTGIGLSTFDNSADYGSEGGTLKSIEFYPQTAFTTHEASNHEIMHQWGNYLDLVGIAGVDGKGHEPSAHTPLTEGGNVARRRARGNPDGLWGHPDPDTRRF